MKETKANTISKLRVVLAGAVVLVTAFVVGTSMDAFQQQLLSGLPSFTDAFEAVQISDGQTPLADQHVDTSTKTTEKTVNLKSKPKKTYTKKLADKVSTKTEIEETDEYLAEIKTNEKIETKEKYTKKKKTKTVVTTTTTTVTTTKYPIDGSANEDISTSEKTTKKTVKLKAKAKKTYTNELPDEVTTKTAVKADGSNVVETETIKETAVSEQYTKNKKNKTVTTTVTTTVITSTYAMKHTEPQSQSAAEAEAEAQQAAEQQAAATPEPAPAPTPAHAAEPAAPAESDNGEAVSEDSGEAAEPAAPAPAPEPVAPAEPEATEPAAPEAEADIPSNDAAPELPEGKSSIATAAPKADSVVISAFNKLGFIFKVDASYQYTGVCDARTRTITLRYNDDNVYHELGHFVAFVAGNYDVSTSFKAIYNEEKSKYNGRNASYVLKDSSEYFAESYRNYVLDKSALQSQRPKTYAAIQTALGKITDSQLNRLSKAYASIWK